MTQFVWYFHREIRCGIETLSINRVSNKEHLHGKNHAENMHQKLTTEPSLDLLYNLKHALHTRNFDKSNIFSRLSKDFIKKLSCLEKLVFKKGEKDIGSVEDLWKIPKTEEGRSQ